ncbi:MAG TPA: hypothetical protein VGN72_10065 [Tepidisphaeraceae bacterium]|jgi:hypothetical protein|nr:hypothetical protein [Tepidisphaeraceae bacterium]
MTWPEYRRALVGAVTLHRRRRAEAMADDVTAYGATKSKEGFAAYETALDELLE